MEAAVETDSQKTNKIRLSAGDGAVDRAACAAPAYTSPAGEAHEDVESMRYSLIASAPAPSTDEVETSAGAVEVMLIWGDNAVLRVDHLSPIRSYYVGESTGDGGHASTDYAIGCELLGTERMPVVLDVGGVPAVVIPAGATGDFSDANGRSELSSLIATGRAQRCAELAGAHQYLLSAGATARVCYRGLTFVVRPVQAGRAVGVGAAQLDPRRSAWTLLSFSIHGLFLLAMYLTPPRSAALSLDLLSDDARHATYLMQPSETLDEQTPDWLPSSEDNPGGDGKRHEGADGQMGKQNSPQTKKKYGVAGPPDTRNPQLADAAVEEETKTAGILGVLARSAGAWNSPTSPFGQKTALGYDPISALGALTGGQIGENFGFGGLGMRGTGRGGGGSGQGTIGAGNLGTIGHAGGGGSGSDYGHGAGGFRDRSARVPQIRSGNADVRGSLSKEVIRRVIQRHLNEVRFCYEQALSAQPALSGRVQVKFVISPSGAVPAANVESSTLGAARAEQCIAQAVRRWAFPAPDGGGVVIVSYPFVLQTADD
jgi:TonB family protein